jgi:hypothetical protein
MQVARYSPGDLLPDSLQRLQPVFQVGIQHRREPLPPKVPCVGACLAYGGSGE